MSTEEKISGNTDEKNNPALASADLRALFKVSPKVVDEDEDTMVSEDAPGGLKLVTYKSERQYIEHPAGGEYVHGARSVKLSDGRIATIRVGNGKDSEMAQRWLGPNDKGRAAQVKMVRHLAAIVTTIDGQVFEAEYYASMALPDWSKVNAEVVDINF